jgi:nitroreductase
MTMMDAIKARISVRTYEERPVEQEKVLELKGFLEALNRGPFGNTVRLMLVDATGEDKSELKKYGSYGNIQGGSRLFIAGAVKSGGGATEDFGYCMEKAVLKATALGLGTVWLGGGLNRSTFGQKVGASAGEVVPAVTPVGYPTDKPSLKENLFRMVTQARKRKPFGEVFFDGRPDVPLTESAAGPYAAVLEAVRISPSASNKQPWRIIHIQDGTYHFYLKEDIAYSSALSGVKIQNVDLGIAMSHFELAASELGLAGKWAFESPALDAGKLQYIASWIPQK